MNSIFCIKEFYSYEEKKEVASPAGKAIITTTDTDPSEETKSGM